MYLKINRTYLFLKFTAACLSCVFQHLLKLTNLLVFCFPNQCGLLHQSLYWNYHHNLHHHVQHLNVNTTSKVHLYISQPLPLPSSLSQHYQPLHKILQVKFKINAKSSSITAVLHPLFLSSLVIISSSSLILLR